MYVEWTGIFCQSFRPRLSPAGAARDAARGMNMKVSGIAGMVIAGVCTALLAGLPVLAAPVTMSDGQVFDAAWYAEHNPDVAEETGEDEALLYRHYQLYGQKEGRTPYDPSLDEETLQQEIAEETARRAADPQAGQAQIVTDPVFYAKVQGIIAAVTLPEQTPEEKLQACYQYVLDRTTYKRTYETPSGDWTKQYASDIYDTGYGNCYRYAAAFAYLAKGLGYEVHVCTGKIQAARGGVTPHGWVEVKIGDQWLICDPDMQDAKHSNYYMRTYENYPVKPLITEQIMELSW